MTTFADNPRRFSPDSEGSEARRAAVAAYAHCARRCAVAPAAAATPAGFKLWTCQCVFRMHQVCLDPSLSGDRTLAAGAGADTGADTGAGAGAAAPADSFRGLAFKFAWKTYPKAQLWEQPPEHTARVTTEGSSCFCKEIRNKRDSTSFMHLSWRPRGQGSAHCRD